MGGINYLFPPEQISNLPSWRFILHFPAGAQHDPLRIRTASEKLKTAEFRIVQFPAGQELQLDSQTNAIDVAIEVTEPQRHASNSLADYESDVWKILGNMASCGYEEVYYEAVDWQEGEAKPKKWWQFWR